MLSLLLLSLLPAAHSLTWAGAQETPAPSPPEANGFSPKPTKAPEIHVKANNNHDLRRMFRRQQSGGESKYPNTCGFVDGNGQFAFTCPGQYACGYNTANFAFGCCSGTSTASDGNVYFTNPCFVDTSTTGCYASTEADQCTGSCTTQAAVCTQSGKPVCRKVVQLGTAIADTVSYTLWDCIPLGGNTAITLQDLYTTSADVTPNPLVDPSYTFDGTTFVPIGGATASASDSASASATESGGGGGGGSGGKKGGKKSNTGAIAGGVVGGLLAIGLIVGAVIWSLIKKKRKARTDAGVVQEVAHVTYGDGK